jgi:hypothetical protein
MSVSFTGLTGGFPSGQKLALALVVQSTKTGSRPVVGADVGVREMGARVGAMVGEAVMFDIIVALRAIGCVCVYVCVCVCVCV